MGQTVDLQICFECHRVKTFTRFMQMGSGLRGSSQPAFDNILKNGGVPLGHRQKGS